MRKGILALFLAAFVCGVSCSAPPGGEAAAGAPVALRKHVPEMVRVEDGDEIYEYDNKLSAEEAKGLYDYFSERRAAVPVFCRVPGMADHVVVSMALSGDTEKDFGKRLFLVKKTKEGYEEMGRTRGMGDSYILEPVFFTGREKEKVLILAELGTEYPWGLLACEISDGELVELGSIDAAAFDEEEFAVDPTPYCTAKRENGKWVVEFRADLALDPGGLGEREILRIGDAPIVFESDGGEFTLKEGSYREQEPGGAESSRYSDELSRLERETGDALARLDEAPDSKERQEEFLRVFERIYNYDSDETIALEADGAFGKAHHRVHAYALAGNKTFLKALMASTLGPYGVGLAVVSERIHDEMLWENFENDARLTLDALSELPPETRARLMNGVYTRPIHDGFDFAAILKKLSETEAPDGMRQDVEKIRDVVEPLAEMMAKVEKVRENFDKGKAAAALGPSGYEEAVREFQKVIAAVPEWPEPYDELGMVHLKQGKTAEAVASLKKYLEKNPLTHPRILNQIRLLILKLEEETEAEP
ncbi:MAG: hypothetical protein JSV08_07670 [Acidobacteriota bacterium]|nr:MAG: hypothetical protein JSV08_07670 [Acidobacteriota bacterium]